MNSEVIAAIFRSDLSDQLDPSQAAITESKYLASYSWLESDVPTILVPGSPPLWTPPVGPLRLEPDSGRVYVDQNAARSPDAPLAPVFDALQAQNPGFEIGGVDIITDRNNIRKLLRFLDGSSSECFQIRVDIVDGKRALFTRMDDESTTVIRGFQGYGRNYEQACTESGNGTSGYYRITSFRFGGLQCVVRNETDGYIAGEPEQAVAQEEAKTTDFLLESLEKLQLADSASGSSRTSKVTVNKGGKEVDCSSIVEIKTRAFGKSLDMNETAAQLWISQTPHLAIAYYKNGVFDDVQVKNMTQYVRDWEKSNQKVLCSLGCLLSRIIKVVKGSASQAAIVRYEGGAKLDIIADGQKKAPSEVKDNSWVVKTGDLYKVDDVSRIPRLASLVRNSVDHSPQPAEIVHEAIPLFDVALKGIESGYRHCFRSMSCNITLYRTLCDTYEFLQIDVCKGRTPSEIIKDLKAGQGYDEDRDRSKARDAAFKLVYCLLRDMFQSNQKQQCTIYNAVLFVVSHPGTFKWKTRNAVRLVYESKFMLSEKQKVSLDRWHKVDLYEQIHSDEDDGSTEGESTNCYDYDSDSW